ncbi:MAG TPA: hypothetical protein VNU71_09085 [Burkholderiaceae bacterium]|nr:hypothetical protein [Burkholderiaceae bacterium]
MTDWLAHPVVQSALAPFLVALASSALLQRSRLLGLAIGAAFFTVVVLAIGVSFESFTSVRKMVLVGAAAVLLVLPLELGGVTPSPRVRAALAGAAALASVWVVLRVLQQRETVAAWGAGIAAAAFMGGLVASVQTARDDTLRAAASAVALGVGAGALALLGASALLAQVGIAVAAGAGATLLVPMITGRLATSGWTLAWPASVVAGLVGLLSVFTGELRWYCLLPLVAVPWAVRAVPPRPQPLWLAAIWVSLAAFVPVAVAIGLALSGGASSSS